MYNIYIRDQHLRKIGEVTDFNKLDMIPRFNGVGSFVLDVPTDTLTAKELIKHKAGIIVKKDGKTVFSGTVKKRGRRFENNIDTSTFAGFDDNSLLAQNMAYPETNGYFWNQAYDVRTGSAEKIMKEYVDFNIGPQADPTRRLLSIQPDFGLGSIVTGRARFHSLIELLSSLALKGGGLGFKIVQVDDSLQFQVYQPADKTRSAFFSPLIGNLASFEYSNEDPEANLVIVGGGGEGVNRIIEWGRDIYSEFHRGRTEIFIDRRDTTDVEELKAVVNEELLIKAEKSTFNFVPIDTPQLSFGNHYGLGDKVSIILTQPNEVIDVETLYYFISAYQTVPVQSERVRKIQEKLDVIQDVVREVKITIDSSGEVITPVVGTEDTRSPNAPKIYEDMKKMNRRLNHLERR